MNLRSKAIRPLVPEDGEKEKRINQNTQLRSSAAKAKEIRDSRWVVWINHPGGLWMNEGTARLSSLTLSMAKPMLAGGYHTSPAPDPYALYAV